MNQALAYAIAGLSLFIVGLLMRLRWARKDLERLQRRIQDEQNRRIIAEGRR